MGYIKKLKNNELVGGTDKHTIYPVTSTKAVFEEVTEGDKSSFKSQETINGEHDDRIKGLENEMPDTVKSITINGGTKTYLPEDGNVELTIYSEGGEDYPGISELIEQNAANIENIQNEIGTDTTENTLSGRITELETLVGGSGQGSVNTRIEAAVNALDVTATTVTDNTGHVSVTLGETNGKIDSLAVSTDDIASAEELHTLDVYVHAIEGGNIRVKTSTPTNPDTSAPANTVYRVAGTDTYSDYMWNGTTMVKMAEYNVDTLESQFGYYKWETASNTISITTSNQVAGSPIGSYVLTSGGSFKIKMTNKATGACTLNMNGKGAKTLLYNGDPVDSNNSWENNEVISVYYDGSVYQASNAQGGSNKNINAYLYGDLRALAVGQTYDVNEAVKTEDKQFLRTTKEIKTMNLVDEVAEGDLNVITSGANLGTYKALKEVKDYNGTETEGLYSIGKPSIVTITVDSSSLSIAEDTDITVTIGNDSETITVPAAASETKDADIAALIKTAFTSVPGWSLTNNEDGTLTLKCTTAGNNTISISSDTGETGLVISSNAVNGNTVLNQYNNGVWETVNINTWVADSAMWESLDENGLSTYTKQNTVTKDIDVKLYGEYDYYTDGTYLTKGTTADTSTNWITFPIVKGHTYRIWLKSNKPYVSNSAGTQIYMSNVTILGTPTVAEMLAGCYRDKTVPANSTATSSGVHLNAGSCIGGVEIYVKAIDLTDATTQAAHEITKPSVLLPKDVVNNLVDGGTEKVLSAEMGKEIGKAISTMKDLELQPLVRKTWGNDSALVNSTTRVCTADAIFVPYFGMTVHYKLPTDYWIYAAFSTFKNPGTLDVNTGWMQGSGTFTIPSDRAQYRIMFAKGSSRNQTITIEEIQELLDSESITLQCESDDSLREIIRRNEHNRYIYSAIIDYGSKKDGLHQLPTFVHGSDVHGDRIRMRNMMKFADHIKAHAALITGDFVAIYPATGYGFINVISDEFNTPMLICDGNHDAQSPLNNDTNRYNAMFKHLAEKHGFMLDDETLSTKCYYYYDMAAIKIRVISVDLYEGGNSFSSTQQTWLKKTMASTPDGYGIIIIDHVQVTSGLTPIQNAEDWYIQATNAEKTALRDIVSAFIGRTGDFSEATTTAEFIMFCNGHNHWDGIGYVTGTSYKQLNCNVDTLNGMYAASSLDSQTSRFPRILGDQSEDLFNVYAIDRANKQVRIARVGANMTGDFTKVEHVVVKYAD